MRKFKPASLLILISLFSPQIQSQEISDIPYTGEEAPKIIPLYSEDFPQIQNPRNQSPKPEGKASSLEELEEIREQNERIRQENEIWLQYQKDLQLQSKIKNMSESRTKNMEKPKNLFYRYTVTKDPDKYLDTFNGLYARFQTGQGTLATINRISNPQAVKPGMQLILPVQQGLYIPKNASSALEILLQKEFASFISEETKVFEIDDREFYFLPSLTFSPTQIAFFHDTGMQLPLSKKIITSEFGYRTSPISGKWKFHAGIDLAAPIGTEVFACKHGRVKTAAYSEIYGNYIVLLHDKNTTSLYAHLSKILVKKGQAVSTGECIGLVGTTGASTGPHLHFEVRENGTPKDPAKMF
ncbi:M23 family peptidase [Treponema ruminis]|uniref:Murein DD-endopeptidase MepM/ murein hydrolase activator NlpD n=1 Tax=Treponema ruminis TaxID=744515 RepID=A0A7W8LLU7_9SPIR|nr:M23 family metallopeptidase [Treponema ruminis]MBB5225841.1 murein DD-endopeptidase MepM/ murein hydrolase activator NlpD [Treponema ruminis]QSI02530.1 M23 family peptidase [Treponema ruminis]